MRSARWHPAFVAALLLAVVGRGCNCANAPAPTEITLVATNTLSFDIFVPDESKQGGLTVGHAGSDGSFTGVPETPACDCENCADACNFDICDCQPTPMAHRIRAGAKFSRTFDGNEHPASRASCGVGDFGPICFLAGEPVTAGSYDLQLCFATNVEGAVAGEDDFSATFDPSALTCVTKRFTYPDQTEWDIAPTPPTPCGKNSACPTGELCQQGVCSATCLASNVPTVGSNWTVAVSITQNLAFFTAGSTTPTRYSGTGVVGAVSYAQGRLDMKLSRTVGAGQATAEIEVQLPPDVTSLAFVTGQTLSIDLVPVADDGTGTSAIAIHDAASNLLFAAELTPDLNPTLTAQDLAPLTVSSGGTVFACTDSDVCGRSVISTVVFGSGGTPVEVQPGQSAAITSGATTWDAFAVANYTAPPDPPVDLCPAAEQFGYVFVARGQL